MARAKSPSAWLDAKAFTTRLIRPSAAASASFRGAALVLRPLNNRDVTRGCKGQIENHGAIVSPRTAEVRRIFSLSG